MKYLNNLHIKQRSFLIKGITALSLSIALQAEYCGGGGTNDLLSKKPDNEFRAELDNRKDISIPDGKGKDYLYASVSNNQLKKAEDILERIKQDKKSNFEYSNKNFPNAYGPDGKTPLAKAIIKGFTEIVKVLVKNKYIDINKAEKGSTSFLVALKNKQKEIATFLLTQTDIDIKTKDTTSGNTTLHWAIIHGWIAVAEKLITKLSDNQNNQNNQEANLLFAKNKEGNTPLHLAMQYKLPTVQDALIKLPNKDPKKLFIKNNKGETVVDIAINKDQKHGIALISQLGSKELSEKNNNGESLLHKTASQNKIDLFKRVFNRVIEVKGLDKAVKQLFDKTKKDQSVLQCIVLSTFGIEPISSNTNIEMLKYVLDTVKSNLNESHWEDISKEITSLEGTSSIKGRISKKYADKLRAVVN